MAQSVVRNSTFRIFPWKQHKVLEGDAWIWIWISRIRIRIRVWSPTNHKFSWKFVWVGDAACQILFHSYDFWKICLLELEIGPKEANSKLASYGPIGCEKLHFFNLSMNTAQRGKMWNLNLDLDFGNPDPDPCVIAHESQVFLKVRMGWRFALTNAIS